MVGDDVSENKVWLPHYSGARLAEQKKHARLFHIEFTRIPQFETPSITVYLNPWVLVFGQAT